MIRSASAVGEYRITFLTHKRNFERIHNDAGGMSLGHGLYPITPHFLVIRMKQSVNRG